MKILIIGEERREQELRRRLSPDADIIAHDHLEKIEHAVQEFDVIFDLNLEDIPQNLSSYKNIKASTVLIASAVKASLAEMMAEYGKGFPGTLAGMNALPTFIDRPIAEISVFKESEKDKVDEAVQQLGWQHIIVDDRVGMVTPRIIFMIINEACYTVQEGTATMADIDAGMKLGTNYPFGPFEWADKIGIKNVYEVISALYEDTCDERYKICPLLKKKYLAGAKFYE